ncbi:MAG: PrgI family protein [Candidatus Moraniibacteriota bacterium]|nr:MAG: PrgI family protein [Candidatus Moranbacteria bacterium]
MLFNVPQFIDVEDKVAGPLTAKQIAWLVGMGAVLFILWSFFDTATFFVLSVPVILLFSLFAFYRPYNQSLLSFTIHASMYLFRPKVYTWDRPGMTTKEAPKTVEKKVTQESPQPLSVRDIRDLARLVDRK